MANLVLFDLDETLIATDTSSLWNKFLFDNNLITQKQHQQRLCFLEDYKNARLNQKAFFKYEIEILRQIGKQELIPLRAKFVHNIIKPYILTKGYAKVEEHKRNNDYVVIITATIKFLSTPIAQLFNVNHLIASEEEMINDEFTGNLINGPCMGDGKLFHLDLWLAKANFKPHLTIFYSDSRNDLPLLLRVNKPIAVDPDEVLKTVAIDNQWDIISFRE